MKYKLFENELDFYSFMVINMLESMDMRLKDDMVDGLRPQESINMVSSPSNAGPSSSMGTPLPLPARSSFLISGAIFS